MPSTTRSGPNSVLSPVGWCVFFLIVALYGGFALAMGLNEALFLLGLGPELKHRAAPLVFVIHALTGAVALFVGPLQSIRWIRRRAAVRRTLGISYVVAVWLASLTAVLNLPSFGAGGAATAMFVLVAVLWFGTTTKGMLLARVRRFPGQHEWMLRSYALSLFFVSFSLWVPALAATSLPDDVSYPLALFLSAALNLAAAEWWIRRTRRPRAAI